MNGRAILYDDLVKMWSEYTNGKALRRLKNGKWEYDIFKPGERIGAIDGTRAEIVKLEKMMSFPEYVKCQMI